MFYLLEKRLIEKLEGFIILEFFLPELYSGFWVGYFSYVITLLKIDF
jgi:hypothetical protein